MMARSGAGSPFVPMQRSHRVLVVVAYLVLLIGILAAGTSHAPPAREWLLVPLVCYVAALLIPIVFYKESYGWLHPLVFGSLLVLVKGLPRSIPMYVSGLDFHIALPDRTPADLNRLIGYKVGLQTLGLLAYYLGFAMARSVRVPSFELPRPRHLMRKALPWVVIAIVVALAYAELRGGLLNHLETVGKSRHRTIGGEHYIIAMTTPGVLAVILWFAYDRKAYLRPTFWACAVPLFVTPFLLKGGRGAVIWYGLTLVCVYTMRERRLPVVTGALLFLFALYLVPVLGEIRHSTWRGEVDIEGAFEGRFDDTIVEGWTGEMTDRSTTSNGTLPILARVPQEVDMLVGNSYLAAATNVVPSAIWPDKPGLVGGRVGKIFFGRTGGTPPGAVGEAYWNFHVPGVVLVYLLFGVFHRWLARIVERHPGQPAIIVGYVFILLYWTSPASRPLVYMLRHLVPLLVLLYFFYGAIRLRRAPQASTTSRPSR